MGKAHTSFFLLTSAISPHPSSIIHLNVSHLSPAIPENPFAPLTRLTSHSASITLTDKLSPLVNIGEICSLRLYYSSVIYALPFLKSIATFLALPFFNGRSYSSPYSFPFSVAPASSSCSAPFSAMLKSSLPPNSWINSFSAICSYNVFILRFITHLTSSF